MKQCPFSSISCCCILSPKVIFLALGVLGLAIGILSAFWPKRSIGLYQWIMERYNWKVTPIDEAREVRNTARLGFLLGVLSAAILALSLLKF